MATTLTSPVSSTADKPTDVPRPHQSPLFIISLLTFFALAIHGYHPYAEDGGIYLAGVKRLLDPALYPKWSEFVTEHLRFSLFAPIVAALVRFSHASLMDVWLVLYASTFWLTLYAALLVIKRCTPSKHAQLGAVFLLATWLTMPIAGTSLMLMDPYLTARSISTPFTLLALVAVLDLSYAESRTRRRSFALCLLALVAAAFVHPLMAAYGLGCALLLGCLLSGHRRVRFFGTAALGIFAISAAALLSLSAPPETTAYREIAMTRSYWFIDRWQWYEQFGLVAPPAILAAIALFFRRKGSTSPVYALAFAGAIAGIVAGIITTAFARSDAHTLLVARLQPLRIFQVVYILMILVVGAFMGDLILRRNVLRWLVAFATLGGVMFCTERRTFPASSHFELPWTSPSNDWQKAFVWISRNTPTDTLLALDSHYISEPGEDAQTFRAIAERSALADYSKDGGEASITPELTPAWSLGQRVQSGLNRASDAQRISSLLPLGVDDIVLPRNAATTFRCIYANASVKVCQLPR